MRTVVHSCALCTTRPMDRPQVQRKQQRRACNSPCWQETQP
jgi:hypothetical protein